VPQALCAKDLPGGRTRVSHVCRIRRIDGHSSESDEDRAPESISDTDNWLDWNGDLDNPNDSDDDWEADNESQIELENTVEETETTEQWNVSSAPNLPRWIRPSRRSKKMVDKVSITVNTMETRRTKRIKTK